MPEQPELHPFLRPYALSRQTHTGVLASYRFSDMISASLGIANTVNSAINSRATDGSTGFSSGPLSQRWLFGYGAVASRLNGLSGALPGDPDFVTPVQVAGSNAYAESYKAYMGSIAFTAPETMGVLAGSTLYAGIVNGFNNSVLGSGLGNPTTSYYLGGTVATPITNLRAGVAFDWLESEADKNFAGRPISVDMHACSLALYASFQASEKLSFHARGEYFDTKTEAEVAGFNDSAKAKVWALTGTAQYDLWRNVISRLELRWDHGDNGEFFGGTVVGQPTAKNAWMLAGNIIYKF